MAKFLNGLYFSGMVFVVYMLLQLDFLIMSLNPKYRAMTLLALAVVIVYRRGVIKAGIGRIAARIKQHNY